MGYLLKEALKALCGVNQWSYAVFWKIGCQNPKLLIWEECFHGSLPNTSAPHISKMGNQGITSQKLEGYDGSQVEDPVHLLMDKMMMSSQVIMVGEGLVGRAAFTGNHQWIVSGNYDENAHPIEVLNEVHLQFSAGMRTVAIIPIIPHGVVQLGSHLAIMENVGFVNDVKSLILQVGCAPSTFMSDNYITKNASSMYGLPVVDTTSIPFDLHRNQAQVNSSLLAADSFNHSSNSLLPQCQYNHQVSAMPNLIQGSCKSRINQPNHPACSNNAGSRVNCPQPSPRCRSSTLLKQSILANGGLSEGNNKICSASSSISAPLFNTNKGHHATTRGCNTNLMSGNSESAVGVNGLHGHSSQRSVHTNMVFHEADSSLKELVGLSNTGDCLGTGKTHDSAVNEAMKAHSKLQEQMSSGKFISDDFVNGSQGPSSKDPVCEDVFFQSSAGDDLFDVLGVDFKNKLLNGNDSKFHNRFGANTKDQVKNLSRSMSLHNLSSDYYEGISESGVFSSSGSDHLLDAVISGVSSSAKQVSDDNMSCKTTLSKISSSSVPSTPNSNPPLSGLVNVSDQMQGQLFWVSKPMVRLGEPVSTSGNCSLTSSRYGSQISSWIEQGPSVSVSTANSKKPDESGKTNRKRLKPGENPRPRPKDRQMIQDRVKELREIVPNGAKCSIDALLERTIKHMLFLQSVTKHADKLKQTAESKITNREGGLLPKDNFEGGATWAFELGSQSMVCPIVVEDLNPPRQLLIEMLCEERGFFLEIADIVRGLGLTILKGVMEARNEKIWARFAVEANRDVTRMEVFISLVHLLEQTLNGSAPSTNGTSNENAKVHSTSMGTNQQLVGPIVCGEPSLI